MSGNVNGRIVKKVTYEWIKNIRFVRKCVWFEPNLFLGFLLTGHGNMNGYLYERRLHETDICDCGNEREDWKHVLTECEFYENIRDLDKWGVRLMGNGVIDVACKVWL